MRSLLVIGAFALLPAAAAGDPDVRIELPVGPPVEAECESFTPPGVSIPIPEQVQPYAPDQLGGTDIVIESNDDVVSVCKDSIRIFRSCMRPVGEPVDPADLIQLVSPDIPALP